MIPVYADWCGPCKSIKPLYEQLSAQLSRTQKVTFVKVDTEKQQEITQRFGVTALPTFIVFKDKQVSTSIRGANPRKLSEMVRQAAAKVDEAGSPGTGETSGGGSKWIGADLPRGYGDITDEVDIQGLDLLNADSNFGDGRTLFDGSRPASLDLRGKSTEPSEHDWVQSDTDEQIMLFVPFRATLKVHTLHITSLPLSSSTDAEMPMRPKTIQLYTNRAHVLGFEEAEDLTATQKIDLRPEDWDDHSGTVKIELRFVKFQNVTSLVLFVVDGDGGADKVRIDRIRIIGETGEKRELGKLEKVGDNGD